MCYDTGTTPKTLCDDASMFSELDYFQSPQQISLGNGHSTITALGQGTIDIIINGKYQIQQHTIMTNCTPVALMASSDNLKYKDCSIIGKHGLLNIIYPSFFFTITGANRNLTFNQQTLLPPNPLVPHSFQPPHRHQGRCSLCSTIHHIHYHFYTFHRNTSFLQHSPFQHNYSSSISVLHHQSWLLY